RAAQCRCAVPRGNAVRRGVRDLGRHGVARSDRHRGRHRLRDPPDDGRDRDSAEEEFLEKFLPIHMGRKGAYAPCAMTLRRTPIFSISTSQTSPFFSHGCGLRAIATPDGVPVMMMSPGSRVMHLLS